MGTITLLDQYLKGPQKSGEEGRRGATNDKLVIHTNNWL